MKRGASLIEYATAFAVGQGVRLGDCAGPDNALNRVQMVGCHRR